MNDLLLCLVIHACILPIFLQDVFQYRFMLVIFGKQLVILSVQLISLNHDWHLQSECRCAMGRLTPAAPRHLASNVLIEHLFGGGEPPILWPTMTVTTIHYDQSMISLWSVYDQLLECDWVWLLTGVGRVRPVQELHHRGSARKMVEGGKATKNFAAKDHFDAVHFLCFQSCVAKQCGTSTKSDYQLVLLCWGFRVQDPNGSFDHLHWC